VIFKVMRFVLFYSDVESFNYFTDRIVEELNKKNHECFVLDLRDMSRSGEHSFERFNSFLEKKADAAIAFDGLGIKDRIFVELWDSMNTLAINILMDHPLRFHPTMLRHPRRYIQFCCDRNHVEYVKKYLPFLEVLRCRANDRACQSVPYQSTPSRLFLNLVCFWTCSFSPLKTFGYTPLPPSYLKKDFYLTCYHLHPVFGTTK